MRLLIDTEYGLWLESFSLNIVTGLLLVYSAFAAAFRVKRIGIIRLLIGLLFGAGAIVSMNFPILTSGGALFDARTVFILVGGLLGGSIGAAASGTTTAVYRLLVGEPGTAASVAGIATTALFGGVLGWRFGCRVREFRPRVFYAIGLAGTVLAVLATKATRIFGAPPDLPTDALIGELLLLPVGTVLLGSAIRVIDFRTSRPSERRMDDFVASVAAMLWEIDAEGRYTFLSERHRDVLGLDPAVNLGRTTRAAGARWIDAENARAAKAALAARAPYSNLVAQIRAHDGTYKTFLVNARPIFDEFGRFTGYRGTAHDISKQRQTEEALRAKSDDLSRAQRVARLGSGVDDLIERKSIWSDEHYRLIGLDPAQGGASFSLYLSRVHPDDRRILIDERARNERGEEPSPIECRIVQPSGEIRWMRNVVEIERDANSRPVKLYSTLLDITAQKELEIALRESRDDLARGQAVGQVGSSVGDLITGKQIWSDEQYRMLGLDPAAGGGSPELYLSCVHPEDRQHLADWRARDLRGEEPGPTEYRVVWPTGEVRWVRRETALERDAQGRPVRLYATMKDITESRRLEEELRRLTDHLQRAQRTAHIGSIELNLVTGVDHWSDGLFQLLGLEPDPAKANFAHFLTHVHPEDRPLVEAEHHQNAHGVAGRPLDYRLVRPDGEERWMRRDVEIEFDASGKPIRLVATHQDITDRRRLEEQLRQSRDDFASALVIGQMGSAIIDLITGKHVWSDELYRMYGLDPAVIEPTFDNFVALIHPDDRPRLLSERAREEDGEDPIPIEFRIVRPDGEVRWVRRHARIERDAAGRPIRLRTSNQDITERRRTESELRATKDTLQTVLDNTIVSLITIDEGGAIVSFNRPAEQMFGYSFEEVVGRNVKMLMPSPDSDLHDGYIANYLATGKAKIIGIGREVTGRRKDGTEFPMELQVAEIAGWVGNHRFVGTARDITERKQTEAQLRQAQKMEAVGQLTGGVAHDFNNLLAVILGRLQMLDEELAAAPQLQNWTRSCIRAVERGAALTKSLLAFSRRQTLLPVELDLDVVVGDMEDMLQRTLGEAFDFRVSRAPALWRTEADPGQLQNALLNLVLNARDAMPDGGTVIVSTTNVSFEADDASGRGYMRPGDYVLLSVSDTGSGMPPEVVERAFEPFFTTKDVGKGSGLGLSMVYGFVKQSGGHVTIDSEPGGGTTVRIYLPRKTGADLLPRSQPLQAGPTLGRAETILLVEDNDDLRDLTRLQLERLGYQVVEASHGAEALRILAETLEIDLLLSDVILPHGMSGPDLAEQAVATRPDLKVVFMSGFSESNATLERARARGPVQLLKKPFHADELAAQIRRALD